MGLRIDRESFTEAEFDTFRERLTTSLVALRDLLADPSFGVGEPTIGAEVEFSLVQATSMRPAGFNHEVLAALADPRLTLELNRFNLEMNLSPVRLRGSPFARIGDEMREVVGEVAGAADVHDARVALIGILPTLTTGDLQLAAISDAARYRALDQGLRRIRRRPFELDIGGLDRLRVSNEHVTLEGANTSFQLHLRVPARDYTNVYNAAQLVTPAALAVGANSPTFLRHRLWDETRIAVFKQSVDDRGGRRSGRAPRVAFGHDWITGGIDELFTDAVYSHEPIIPVLSDEDPVVAMMDGRVPELLELRLHQSTVWRWNRPVFDPRDGGHFRIEFRSLPSGPTPGDMLASGAFLLGAALALAPRMPGICEALPFESVNTAFYRAARFGLGADLPWVRDGVAGTLPAAQVVAILLPLAFQALVDAGVDPADVERTLEPISGRLENGQTGAVWQRRALDRLSGAADPYASMLAAYLDRSATERPVHTWEPVD